MNAQRSIPLSVILTLIVVASSYMSVSAVLTLMIPYYMLDPDIPMPQAFDFIGYNWAKNIVTIGAIISITASLYSSMFPVSFLNRRFNRNKKKAFIYNFSSKKDAPRRLCHGQ